MDKFIVESGVALKGVVRISGSKNAALPIMAACLLTEEPCRIKDVPALADINTMVEILRSLGAIVERDNGGLLIDAKTIKSTTAEYRLVSTMRGSFCVLGPLLARCKHARVAHPGGCSIGVRPVDLHIKGLEAIGAEIEIEEGYVVADARRLTGTHLFLGGLFGSSVLATANVMTAAVLAEGKTVIESAACEPELEDLGNFLNKMGAKIKGHGTPRVEIVGVEKLHGAEHRVIPDRIEAATFMIAALITGGTLEISNVVPEHLIAVTEVLRQAGAEIAISADSIIKVSLKDKIRAVNTVALPYPAFPTDVQAQLMSLMTVADGMCVVTDKIFPDRFMHVAELLRMGAHIQKEGSSVMIHGVDSLSGAEVMASDLRASACLVLAGLIAKGQTTINRIYHLDRGYEELEVKLRKLGAKIKRVK